MYAFVGSYNVGDGSVTFYSIPVIQTEGDLWVECDDGSGALIKVSDINDDGFSTDIVELLSDDEKPDEDLEAELRGVFSRRFEFLKQMTVTNCGRPN